MANYSVTLLLLLLFSHLLISARGSSLDLRREEEKSKTAVGRVAKGAGSSGAGAGAGAGSGSGAKGYRNHVPGKSAAWICSPHGIFVDSLLLFLGYLPLRLMT